jgi:hypothetical protein
MQKSHCQNQNLQDLKIYRIAQKFINLRRFIIYRRIGGLVFSYIQTKCTPRGKKKLRLISFFTSPPYDISQISRNPLLFGIYHNRRLKLTLIRAIYPYCKSIQINYLGLTCTAFQSETISALYFQPYHFQAV